MVKITREAAGRKKGIRQQQGFERASLASAYFITTDEDRIGGGRKHGDIATIFEISVSRVKQVCKDCVIDGLEAALETKRESKPKARLSGSESDEKLTVLARLEAPAGDADWTLQFGGDRKMKLEIRG
ncbi:MAG: hypothetical protein OXE94_05370 [Aestuariivita sp.]|nr:hypothetical protein [Aestuariivita sp.]MCY4202011.1 hypothetical protein [Aestuariivita sp.]